MILLVVVSPGGKLSVLGGGGLTEVGPVRMLHAACPAEDVSASDLGHSSGVKPTCA